MNITQYNIYEMDEKIVYFKPCENEFMREIECPRSYKYLYKSPKIVSEGTVSQRNRYEIMNELYD